ncbi:MAG: NUDIX hydrolase [Acidimicrobiales bacterium]|nr:NUDIX hydrolase [Acidimicrobiales bacterium]
MACDVGVIRSTSNGHQILLVERRNNPYQGFYALPGGFVEDGETLIETAVRELFEETNVSLIPSELVFVAHLDSPERDPRGRIITALYGASVSGDLKARAGDDAKSLAWFDINSLPELAFDHNLAVKLVLEKLEIKA